MKRYITINADGLNCPEDNFYEDSLPDKEFEPSLADKSKFVPVIDLTKVTANITDADNKYFDFADGVDDGSTTPRVSHKDLAEQFVDARDAVAAGNSAVADAKAAAEQTARIDAIVNGRTGD